MRVSLAIFLPELAQKIQNHGRNGRHIVGFIGLTRSTSIKKVRTNTPNANESNVMTPTLLEQKRGRVEGPGPGPGVKGARG